MTWSWFCNLFVWSLRSFVPRPKLGCMTCFVQASEVVGCKKTASLMVVH